MGNEKIDWMSKYKNPDKKREYAREYSKRAYANKKKREKIKLRNKKYQKKHLEYWRNKMRGRNKIKPKNFRK